MNNGIQILLIIVVAIVTIFIFMGCSLKCGSSETYNGTPRRGCPCPYSYTICDSKDLKCLKKIATEEIKYKACSKIFSGGCPKCPCPEMPVNCSPLDYKCQEQGREAVACREEHHKECKPCPCPCYCKSGDFKCKNNCEICKSLYPDLCKFT